MMEKNSLLNGGSITKPLFILALILFFSALNASNIHAEGDTDIFKKTSVPPNVMIIVDTSKSMDKKDVKEYVYNPLTNYSEFVPSGKLKYNKNDIYLVPSNGKVGDNFSVFIKVDDQKSDILPKLPNWKCEREEEALRENGRCDSQVFGDKHECCKWINFCGDTRDLRRGNYLNYQYLGQGSTGTDYRINVVRKVISNALRTISGVRWGLMRNNMLHSKAENRASGGKILAECGTDPDKILRIINQDIKDKDGNNNDFDFAFTDPPKKCFGTDCRVEGNPMGSMLADAGLYFANKRLYGGSRYSSGFWAPKGAGSKEKPETGFITKYDKDRYASDGSYDDPMLFDLKGDGKKAQYSCQKNYVILISDSMSSHDIPEIGDKKWDLWRYKYIDKVANNRAIHSDRPNFEQCKFGRDCEYDGTCSRNQCGSLFDCNAWYKNNNKQDANNYLDFDGDGCDPTPCHNGDEKKCWKEGQTSEEKCSTGTCSDNGGSHYLDDVAYLLNGTDDPGFDLRPDIPGKQTVQTYTIGIIPTDDKGDLDGPLGETLLKLAAKKGGGTYKEAGDASRLEDMFHLMVKNILIQNSTFAAPVVPVDKNQMFSGNSAYFAYFSPTIDGNWKGNLKKYRLMNGKLCDVNGTPFEDSNGKITITDKTTSCWSLSADGTDVLAGGMVDVLSNGNSKNVRHFFTHSPKGNELLSSDSNIYSDSNAAITPEVMGIDSTTFKGYDLKKVKDAVIDYTSYNGRYQLRTPILGDIVHSRPAIFQDISVKGKEKNIIFAGANDGFLHCFIDDVSSTTANSVHEEWCFTPWSLLPKMRMLHPEYKLTATGNHYYFVDGYQTIYKSKQSDTDTRVFITFGLRRGGEGYTTLEIGKYDESKTPPAFTGEYEYKSVKFVWEHDKNFLVKDLGETLGQSWGKPFYCKFKTGAGLTDFKQALIMVASYDHDNEDHEPPTDTNPKGRALYVLDAKDGSFITGLTHKNFPDFTHSIVDFTAIDYNDDTFIDSVYLGDLKGNVFALNDRDHNGTWDWEYVLKRANISDTNDMYFKVFYAPDVVLCEGYDFLFWGTGDREHTANTKTINRIYGVKNTWNESNIGKSDSPVVKGENELLDVTDYANVPSALPSDKKGWFIRLCIGSDGKDKKTGIGEKMVSSPIVYDGVVYFTTYIPYQLTDADICEEKSTSNKAGEGRFYAVDYLTGKAVFDLDQSGNPELNEKDRFRSLGDGMPTEPTLIATKDGIKLLIATAGAPFIIDTSRNSKRPVDIQYWRQK